MKNDYTINKTITNKCNIHIKQLNLIYRPLNIEYLLLTAKNNDDLLKSSVLKPIRQLI